MTESQLPAPLAHKAQRVTFDAAIERSSISWHIEMETQVYETFNAENTTNEMLAQAAYLFNGNYGTWGPQSHRPGQPVRLSPQRLRDQYLLPRTEQSDSFFTRVTNEGNLLGYAISCRWMWQSKTVCWITQLVVDQHHRGQGIASILLRTLGLNSDDIYGVMSSHPAACLAAAKAYGRTIERVNLNFIKENAYEIMSASPIPYIRDAKLRGTLFDHANGANEIVSGVDTNFFVDHTEPLQALAAVEDEWQWPLGGLPDGHEYLLILPARQRRSRSRSAGPNH